MAMRVLYRYCLVDDQIRSPSCDRQHLPCRVVCRVEPDYFFRQFQDAVAHFSLLDYSAEIVGAVPICAMKSPFNWMLRCL